MSLALQAAGYLARSKKGRRLLLTFAATLFAALAFMCLFVTSSIGAIAGQCQQLAQSTTSSGGGGGDTGGGDTPSGYVSDNTPTPSSVPGIPSNYLPVYQDAAKKYGIDWTVLAAIGFVESGHGEGGKEEDCIGSSAGAQGPMEFMPSVWASLGIDGNGDGKKDVCNYQDAIYSAAKYLRDSGAPQNYQQAVFAYNHAQWYVDKVMAKAAEYRQAAGGGSGQKQGVTASPATLPQPPLSAGANGVPSGASGGGGGSGSPPQGWSLVDSHREIHYKLYTRYASYFKQAAAEWNALGGVKFVSASSGSDTYLVVVDGNAPGSRLAQTSSTGKMTLDTYYMSMSTPNARLAALAHEEGHAEGYNHTSEPSVMDTPIVYNATNNYSKPTPYDISVHNQAWGTSGSGSGGSTGSSGTDGSGGSTSGSGRGGGGSVQGNQKAVFPLPKEYFDSYDDTWGGSRPGTASGHHEGTDIFANDGTPIYSITDGKVVRGAGSNPQGWDELGGWTTMIRSTESIGPIHAGDNLYYAHQIEPSPVKVGQTVKAGQVIGHVDSSGEGPPGTKLQPASRGHHLHLGWYDPSGARAQASSGAMNPYPLLNWLKQHGGTVTGGSTFEPGPSGGGSVSLPAYCLPLEAAGLIHAPQDSGGGNTGTGSGGGGSGGGSPGSSKPGSSSAKDLLNNPNVSINPQEAPQLKEGKIDSRLIATLQMISKKHKIYVSAFIDDGVGATLPGTNIPNSHYFGRAADVAKIDGMPVTGNGTNPAVLDVGKMLKGLPPEQRPDEIIGPSDWISTLGYPRSAGFISDPSLTDVHRDHLHIGFFSADGTSNTE